MEDWGNGVLERRRVENPGRIPAAPRGQGDTTYKTSSLRYSITPTFRPRPRPKLGHELAMC
jgi:hypothetical protein